MSTLYVHTIYRNVHERNVFLQTRGSFLFNSNRVVRMLTKINVSLTFLLCDRRCVKCSVVVSCLSFIGSRPLWLWPNRRRFLFRYHRPRACTNERYLKMNDKTHTTIIRSRTRKFAKVMQSFTNMGTEADCGLTLKWKKILRLFELPFLDMSTWIPVFNFYRLYVLWYHVAQMFTGNLTSFY